MNRPKEFIGLRTRNGVRPSVAQSQRRLRAMEFLTSKSSTLARYVMHIAVMTCVVATVTWHASRIDAQDRTVPSDEEAVGHAEDGRIITPVNQVLTPIGKQLDLPQMRPQALALSPDGTLLVTAGKT